MADKSQTETETSDKKGRPRKGDGPSFPAEVVDRLLVHGEPVPITDSAVGQIEGVRYPSYREIASRYGVSHSLIARYAKQHNCLARREETKNSARQLSDEKLVEQRANVMAFSRDDQVRTIDRYLLQFEEAVAEGRVRFDNPSDFNLLCRLRAFLMGEAESRHEVQSGMPTLEELQQRYKEMREEWGRATPEEREQLPEHLYGFDGVARSKAGNGKDAAPADADDTTAG